MIYISEYTVANYKISLRNKEKDLWCIFDGGTVWDFELNAFVFEPSPSNRNEDFIKDTRRSLDECIEKVINIR